MNGIHVRSLYMNYRSSFAFSTFKRIDNEPLRRRSFFLPGDIGWLQRHLPNSSEETWRNYYVGPQYIFLPSALLL